MKGVKELIAKACDLSPSELEQEIARLREQDQRRREARQERQTEQYHAALNQETPVQMATCVRLAREGYQRSTRVWQSKRTGRIAVMLSKQAWNPAKGRMGRKLVMVYPDGTRAETFEKSISLRKDF